MDTQTLLNFGLVVLFVMVGGVFAATEIALVSLRDSQLVRLEQQGARGARVAAVARDPNRFLAAVQIGVTVAGFFSAAYGGATLAPDLTPYLVDLGLPEGAAETTALVVMTLLIAYLSLVLGELVPKRLALQRSAAFSLAVAPPLDRFASLMRPVIRLLSVSTNALVRLLGGDPSATSDELTEEELRDIVETHQSLGEHERRILRDVFAASQTSLKEVMRPRGEVDFVKADLPLPAAADHVRQRPWSRYPVIGDGFDDVRGFIHVRDLLDVTPDDRRRVRDIAREVPMLPATNRVLPTVTQMRQDGIHLAVVIDEYGGTDGIVTLEDLVEELVGEIRDEYDEESVDLTGGDASVVDARITIEEFADRTGVELEDGSYETVAGYVIAQLGRLPDVGDRVISTAGRSRSRRWTACGSRGSPCGRGPGTRLPSEGGTGQSTGRGRVDSTRGAVTGLEGVRRRCEWTSSAASTAPRMPSPRSPRVSS
jgi:putative hemolysin